MKKILAILLLAAVNASAGVPFWQPPMASTSAAYGTAYMAGNFRIYDSTRTAAGSPKIQLNGVTGYINAASSVTALGGFYGGLTGSASNNVLKAGDSMTGGLSINAVSSATTLSVLNQRTSATNTGANIQAVGSGATENIALWLEGNLATKNTALFISSPAAGASNYAIHSQSLAQSKFLGTIAAPAGFIGPLTGNADTATTATTALSVPAYAAALSTAAYLSSTQTFTGSNTMSGPLTLTSSLTVTGSDFSVAGSTLIVAAGRVGVGTTPTTSISKIFLTLGDMVGDAFAHTLASAGGTTGIYMGRSALPAAGGVIYANGSDTLTLRSANANRLTIDTNGDVVIANDGLSVGGNNGFSVVNSSVSIGTTTPTSMGVLNLQAYAPYLNFYGNASQISGIIFRKQTNSQYDYGGIKYDNGTDSLIFRAGYGDRATITTTGNFGLNDTTPDGQLDIVSNSSPIGYVISVSSQNGTTGNLFSLLGNGNAGIGDTSPQAKLVVNGNIVSSGTVQGYSFSGSGSGLSEVSNLVSSVTVSVATGTITFSGLDGNADGEYRLVFFSSTTDSGASFSLYFNSDVTAANYYVQRIAAGDTTVSGSRANNSVFMYTTGMATPNQLNARVSISRGANGRILYSSQGTKVSASDGSDIASIDTKGHHASAQTNITSITISGPNNVMLVGTTCELYRSR